MPILQMKRLRHSYWELELRCTAGATYSQTLCFTFTSITSLPNLFSFQPPTLVLLLKQAHPSVDTTNTASKDQQRFPCPLLLIKEIIKVNGTKKYNRFSKLMVAGRGREKDGEQGQLGSLGWTGTHCYILNGLPTRTYFIRQGNIPIQNKKSF